jgi:hypothetical protein
MAGLLDFTDDPKTMGLLSLGLGMLNSKGGNVLTALGQAGPGALDAIRQVKQDQQRKQQLEQQQQMQAMQLQQAQMQLAEAQRAHADRQRQQDFLQSLPSPQMAANGQAMANGGGPSVANAGKVQQVDPMQQLMFGAVKSGALPLSAYITSMQKDDTPIALSEGGKLVTRSGRQLAANPKAPDLNSLVVMGPDGKPMLNQLALDAKRQVAAAGAARTNVAVNTAKPFLNTIAEGLGKNIDASLSNAQAAIPAIQTAQTLKQAADSGKLIAGPGSTFRVLGLQVGQMLGVGGKDGAEILSNTRTAIQSMAKAELDAAAQMKGQGQITEAERGIIKRAAAGDIDSLTAPEIRLLADGMEKTARYKIRQHQANVSKLGQMPGAEPIMPFYSVEEPAAYSGGGSAVRKFNPATGKIE